ncbi:MAG: hypothetical protein ACP5O3_01350 [Candidatus Micrarchaeia archaeon]
MKKLPALPCTSLLFLALPLLVGAACADFQATVASESQSIEKGETAVYALLLSNSGLVMQDVMASAQCPSGLNCEFEGISYPTLLPPSGSLAAHFYVYSSDAKAENYSIPLEITANEAGKTCTTSLLLSLEVKPTNKTRQGAPVAVTLNPPETQVVLPGNSAKYFLSISNNYDKKIYATLSDEGNPFKDSTYYSYSTLSLEAGETKNVEFTVSVPPSTPGKTYEWTLQVKSSAGDFADVAVPLSLQVYAKTLAVTLLNAPYPFDCAEVKTGGKATIPLTLRNDGEITGPFSLELEGSQAALAMASLDRKLLELKNGEQADVAIKIRPPLSTTSDEYYVSLVGKYGKYEFLRRTICFKVTGFENLEVAKPAASTVTRPTTAAIPFTVKNTGTLEEEIAFEWMPQNEVGFVSVEPTSFKLPPGESLKASLIVSTSMQTPLKDYVIPVKLLARNSNYSLAINFNVSVISSNKSGESFLQIIAPKITAAEEGSNDFTVTVLNTGSQNFDKVVLAFEGIPKDWASVDFPRAIPSNSSADYTFTVTAPKGSAGTYPLVLYAIAGRESVKQETVLEIKPFLESLNFQVKATTEKKSGGKTSAVTIVLRVENNGDKPLTSVSPSLFADDVTQYNFEAEPENLVLNPGDAADLKLTIKPNKQTAPKALPILLSSEEGKSAPQTVAVPAMTAEATAVSAPFPFKTATVIVLLIVIFALMAYEPKKKQAA